MAAYLLRSTAFDQLASEFELRATHPIVTREPDTLWRRSFWWVKRQRRVPHATEKGVYRENKKPPQLPRDQRKG